MRELLLKEGFDVYVDSDTQKEMVKAYGKEYPIVHPLSIYLKLFREETNPELKFHFMKKVHDFLWSHHDKFWNYWTERRFRAHCADKMFIAYAGGASTGKAQPLSAKIRTPSGWTTMGELKIGSLICDTEGGIQTVKAIHPQGIQDIYRVSFSDETTTETTSDHLWKVYSKKQRDRGSKHYHILSTENLKPKMSIPLTQAVWGIEETPLPVDPWLLGYYIGNGCTNKTSSSTITTPHLKYVDKIKERWSDCVVKKYTDRNCYSITLRGFRTILNTIPELRFKKSSEKQIPLQYLQGSVETRKQLLQGLIDSDGHTRQGVAIAFSNEKLRDQTVEIARSLGLLVYSRKDPYLPFYKNKQNEKIAGLPSYSLYISNWNTVKTKHKIVTKVEKVRRDYAQCITVSNPNSLYITDDYIVTHNSYDAAKIAIIFWLADPEKRGVVIASTTLKSLEGRIWGYIVKLFKEMKIKVPYYYKSSPSPTITYRTQKDRTRARGEAVDLLHGMFAIAAGKGSDSETIKNWIGRHPDNGLLVVLDEGTDMPVDILDAVPNLDMAQGEFQMMIIGNSCSRFDLHGILSTPKVGWANIDPVTTFEWETTQYKGVCLFFSCYESPAIFEEDPERREALGRFLMTREKLDRKEKEMNKNSDTFWRFVIGFWRSASVDYLVMSEQFMLDFPIEERAHFSGVYPLEKVGGLDLSFATEGEGDTCILRLALYGVDVQGNVVLDFRKEKFVFKIPIIANASKSAETQIAEQVLDILEEQQCPLENVCFDGSGAGRAMGAFISVVNNNRLKERGFPVKGDTQMMRVFSTKHGVQQKTQEANTYVRSHLDLWQQTKKFIEKNQVKGIDDISKIQFTTRLIVTNEKTKKQGLEQKQAYKKRMGGIMPSLARSPDEADAFTLTIQAAMIRFGMFEGQKKEVGAPRDFVPTPTGPDFRQAMIAVQEHDKQEQLVASKQVAAYKGPTLGAGFRVPGVASLLPPRKFH